MLFYTGYQSLHTKRLVVTIKFLHCVASWPLIGVYPYQVLAKQGRARTALMTLPHFTAETPMFMPVGTKGEAWLFAATPVCVSFGLWVCCDCTRVMQGNHTL